MDNKFQNNKLFNLNHKSDYYLMNNYEKDFDANEWNNNNYINWDDNITINDDYDREHNVNKKYSLSQKKGNSFK